MSSPKDLFDELIQALTCRANGTNSTSVHRVLADISSEGSPLLAPLVASLVPLDDCVEEASHCLAQLIERASPMDFILMSQRESYCSYLDVISWSHRSMMEVLKFKLLPQSNIKRVLLEQSKRSPWLGPFAVVASLHPNGFVRQAALEAIEDQGFSRAGLAMALIRRNDWVSEIRDVASRIVRDWLSARHASVVIELLPLVARMQECERSTHSDILHDIGRLIHETESFDLLESHIQSTDSLTRRAAFTCAKVLPVNKAREIFLAQSKEGAAHTRSLALREYMARVDDEEKLSMAHRFLTDKNATIRKQALRVICRLEESNLESTLRNALYDENQTVRMIAVFHLKKVVIEDLMESVRFEIKRRDSSRLRPCIDLLGEHGANSDVAVLLPFLSSPESRLRASVVRALSRLDAQGHKVEILEAVFDESPRVSREARESALRRDIRPDRERFRLRLLKEGRPHVRRNGLRVLLNAPALDAMEDALRFARDRDKRVVAIANRRILKSWRSIDRAYTKVCQDQLKRVISLADSAPLTFGLFCDFYRPEDGRLALVETLERFLLN